MRVYRIASVLALLLLAVRGWPAECSWPAGEAGDRATYPNQGHRIEKNGQNLHIIYDAYNYYDPLHESGVLRRVNGLGPDVVLA